MKSDRALAASGQERIKVVCAPTHKLTAGRRIIWILFIAGACAAREGRLSNIRRVLHP
jgi:hypothetical protein